MRAAALAHPRLSVHFTGRPQFLPPPYFRSLEAFVDDHKTVSNDNYEVSFHPAFASSCVIEPVGGKAETLYRQDRSKPVDCRKKGHPKQHKIKLKAKNGKRDITLTIDDPNHNIATLQIRLYHEDRVPGEEGEYSTIFTVENNANTCPPNCDDTPPG
jgi:hypothetical protein